MPVVVDKSVLREVRRAIGRAAKSSGRVYFTGGATAIRLGLRQSTVDVDLALDPEPAGVFEALARLKRDLKVPIELARPSDFVPELRGWRDRSPFIERVGQVDFFDYDAYSQALAKLSRYLERDRGDVAAMVQNGMVVPAKLLEFVEEAQPAMIRYPNVDPDRLLTRCRELLDE